MSASAGVGVYVIGYTTYASYGYHAGARSADINSPITCDAGGPYSVGCSGGAVVLDGTGSSGPGVLSYLWSALTPGVIIATPDAATTSASASGAGPWTVSLTVTNGVDTSNCIVTIDGGVDGAPPVVDCPAQVDAVPTAPTGTLVGVTATASDACDPNPTIGNDRTAGGGDATDLYPCGETLVTFTATDASGQSASCATRVVVMSPAPPAGVSESGAVSWLKVAKIPGDATLLDITMEVPSDPATLVNLYAGSLPSTGFAAYDHAPVSCHVAPAALGGGAGLLHAPFDAGQSRYYLVSASNCLAEGTRGSRSDGAARPALPTDCGALP